jgi:aminoglycoside/choline kinase family phosphotransferase
MTAIEVINFLSDTDWNNATIDWFDADWSVRRYARLTKSNAETAILLQSPPDDHADALEGHMIGPWSKMNHHFKSIEVNVPTIIKEDLSNGLILMGDFGTDTIRNKGIDAYLKATDILIQMRDHSDALSIPLIKYDDTHVYKALRFFPEFVLNDSSSTDAWFKTWKDIENALPPCPRALTHIDFAAMNLMWVNNEVGVIDFQAACDGPFVYDIVNLLEDIRIDISDDIKQACKNHYCALLSPETRMIFDQWYVVVTAQFHARILGQIQFLAKAKGRDDLMQYYDPLKQRFEKEIEDELLKPVKDFINRRDGEI